MGRPRRINKSQKMCDFLRGGRGENSVAPSHHESGGNYFELHSNYGYFALCLQLQLISFEFDISYC